MRLVKPSYEIVRFPDAERDVATVARTCYKSEDRASDEADEALILNLLQREHSAMLEFGGAPMVKFVCDRGVSHELVRHRLCSFAQESTRYCDYGDSGVVFVIPPWIAGIEPGEYRPVQVDGEQHVRAQLVGHSGGPIPVDEATELWMVATLSAEAQYQDLREAGWQPQQARSVLPNSLKTEIVVQANTREWMHIFHQRTAKAAHPQMRELMVPLAAEFAERMPLLFGRWAGDE